MRRLIKALHNGKIQQFSADQCLMITSYRSDIKQRLIRFFEHEKMNYEVFEL